MQTRSILLTRIAPFGTDKKTAVDDVAKTLDPAVLTSFPVPVLPLPNRDLPAASALPPEAGTVRRKRVPLQDLEAALEQYATIAAAVDAGLNDQ